MKKLKIDFHTHSGDDPLDKIGHSALKLIDKAAELGFDAIALTNHEALTYNIELRKYAESRGILLLPGVEATFAQKDVVIINPIPCVSYRRQTLEELERFKRETSLIIAPHPYYPTPRSLKDDLKKYINFFDAIEFSQCYNHVLNPNQPAAKIAEEHGLPVLGNSDCHFLWQLGKTYTLVEAEKNLFSIIQAVKEGRVEMVTTPISIFSIGRITLNFFLSRFFKLPIRI
ncbi:PHP domain-containing protein [Candidatus Aminicenantes bacterium AC-334-K16]|jgi:hypothetical protein|nr:PHP domain-containing protein [Candidatus Aminicenantes bacterium AC-334-K16]